MYVPEGDERWPREFWGMGVRIEDVVCVEERGEPGPLVLSSEAVKEVSTLCLIECRVGNGGLTDG